MSLIRVGLRLANGQTESIEVDPSAGIGDVRALVSTRLDIPLESLKLIFKAQILKDDRTLTSYGKFYHDLYI